MLLGQYQTKINEKGRVALPVKYKRILGKKIIITAGYEQSLMIVTQKDWQAVVDRITQGSTLGPTRETDRFLLGSAHDVELDNQSRFVIPKHLREFANLVCEIVFVGVGNRAEIWNQFNWETYSQNLNKKVKELAATLDQVK